MADEGQIKLVGVRLSFPDIWKAKAIGKGEAKFGAAFLLDKKEHEAQIESLRSGIIAVALDKWAPRENPTKDESKDERKERMAKIKEMRTAKSKPLQFCLHEGNEKTYDGYDESNMFLSASSKKRPLIIDRDRTPLSEDDNRPYAGCYVDAIVKLWPQDNEYGRRVNADLLGIQFVKDGEAFGVGPVNPDAFTDYSEKEPAEKRAASNDATAEDAEIPF